MSPDTLQALGWLWCALGFAWHVRTAPAIVRRPVLGPQPLTVTLERVGGDGIRATGRLEVDPGVETSTVVAALDDVKRNLMRSAVCSAPPGRTCLDEDCACQDVA